MDWFLDGRSPGVVADLRKDVIAYLARHAAAGSDLGGAELVISELVTNSVLHATGPAWVSVVWDAQQPVLTVSDLGPGFVLHEACLPEDATAIGGRGLYIVSKVASTLTVDPRRDRGVTVSARLPVQRGSAMTFDPPRHRSGALPALDEAQREGGFPIEAFLRALVVQLAQAVEEQEGPEAAEAAVAQVGTDVGGQMEAEYRLATEAVGRLTADQMGEAYVRLKAAIGGGFSVVEADERRIVLANTRCPFGEVVRQAPALCRMTSSVFGGIAARNSERGAAVLLEERIAVGDPGCRVVVWIDPDDATLPTGTHRYIKPLGQGGIVEPVAFLDRSARLAE